MINDVGLRLDRPHPGLHHLECCPLLLSKINSPISVMETAVEGGAWGIALLAAYAVGNAKKQSLADWLETNVFAGNTGVEIAPTKEDVEGFNRYIEAYKKGLAIEKAAVEAKK